MLLIFWTCFVLATWLSSVTFYVLARRAEAQARALLAETVALVNAVTEALNLASPGAVDAALETQAREEAVRVFEEHRDNIGSIQ